MNYLRWSRHLGNLSAISPNAPCLGYISCASPSSLSSEPGGDVGMILYYTLYKASSFSSHQLSDLLELHNRTETWAAPPLTTCQLSVCLFLYKFHGVPTIAGAIPKARSAPLMQVTEAAWHLIHQLPPVGIIGHGAHLTHQKQGAKFDRSIDPPLWCDGKCLLFAAFLLLRIVLMHA